MTEVIPAVLASTLKELKEQLHLLSFAKKLHIDIMDGKFVPNKTITALALKKVLPKAELQIHLMAHKPHTYLKSFSRLGAREFIFHAEATDNAPEILEDARALGMKAGIAFNPETQIARYADALVHADLALVMTVHPGFSGQTFLAKPLSKIAALRKHNPLLQIGIDGGVNDSTCVLVQKAGADFVCAKNAILAAKEPKKAFSALSRKMA